VARPVRWTNVAAVALCALALVGCVDESEGVFTEEWRAPIVDGVRETGEPAVVMIYHDYGAGCTASVVAPRVLITARHCVRQNEGLGAYYPVSGWHVLVGPSVYSAVAEYRVSDVRSTDGAGIDNNDFAVMILDRDFTYGTKRWAFMPWPGFMNGARITAIGYGQTRFNDPDSSGTKYRRDGTVQALGPLRDWALGDREFMSMGENTCQGDSGGPLLYNDVVVGVVSRGEEGCTGRGWMTRVSSYADMVRQALRDTGACEPTGIEVCNLRDDDCFGGADDGLGATCPCAGGGGASEEICDQVDNDCNGEIDDMDTCGCRGGAAPTTEVCDGIDNDCNGAADEVCQHLGDPCGEDRECSTQLCLDGVCTAHCRAGVDECIEEGYCDGPPCGDGLCRPGRGSRGIGGSCGANGECASGFCAPTATGASVCARPCVPDQLACFSTEACGALAEGCGACFETDQWNPPRFFGEPCQVDGDCIWGYCATDGDDGACGDSCAYRYCVGPCFEDGSCPPGGHCRDGTCFRGPSSEPGEMCMTNGDCPGGSCIALFGTPRCAPPCGAEGACQPSFVCVDGVCWPEVRYPGDPCAEGEDHLCVGFCDHVGGQRLCLEPCWAARDCTAGMVCLPYADRLAGACVPNALAGSSIGGGGDGGPCECVAAGRATPPSPIVLTALAAAFLVLRRRRG